jgi:HK97 family phage portal protein
MAWINRLTGSGEQRSDTPLNFADVYGRGLDLFTSGARTRSGSRVTSDSALQSSTVFACVRILSDSIATLPMDQMIRLDGVPRPSRPRATWMDFEVGPWNKVQIVGQIMTSMLLEGNAYVATTRMANGEIVSLDVVDPKRVEPQRLADGSFAYKVQHDDGTHRMYANMDIKHFPGMMLPGAIEGVSPIHYAKETIGLAMSATEFGAAFFGNGAIPGSTIEVPGQLSPTAAQVIKSTWEEAHRGVANSGRLAVLTEGARYSKVTLSPNESQFLETRQFQVPDIARFFGVPLNMLGADGTQYGDTTAEQNAAFVRHSLRPWVERVEAGFTDLLVSEGRPRGNFVRLNVDGLLRGNMTERVQAYSTAVVQGIWTINEVRRWEGLAPVPWGDEPISVQVQEEPVPGLPSSEEAPNG